LTSVSELNGKKVIDASAFALGEVEGAELDTRNWQITHLQVKLTSEATEQRAQREWMSYCRFKMPWRAPKLLCSIS
jgi:sporulation protein YlmC with PRC-barrel domain